MHTLKEIAVDRRGKLAGLFAHHKRMRIMIEAVLEGQFGTALADAEDEPRLAQLSIKGIFHMFGGDPQHPLAHEMLRNLPLSFVLLDSDAWRKLLFQIYGERVQKQARTALSSAELDSDRLHSFVQRVSADFQVQRINVDIARRIASDLETKVVLHLFRSEEDLVERGVGFAALSGQRVVCVATSAVI